MQLPDARSLYKLQNVKINTAMVLTDERQTDMMFDMRATQGQISTESRWFSFTVSSVNASNEWTEHATGMVAAETSGPCKEITNALYPKADIQAQTVDSTASHLPLKSKSSSSGSIDRRWYSAMEAIGLGYGPSFQPLNSIQSNAGEDEATANVLCSATKGLMIQESEYVVHPTALDGCFQLSIIAAHKGEPRTLVKPYLPVIIEQLSLWNRPRPSSTHDAMVYGYGRRQGLRSIHTKLNMVDGDGQAILKARLKFLSLENSFGKVDDKKARQPYTRLVWKPDFDRLSSQKANELFHAGADNQIACRNFRKLEEISALSILDSLDCLPKDLDSEKISSHLANLLEWMTAQGRILSRDPIFNISASERKSRIASITQEVGTEVPEALMVAKLNSRMPDIITGAVGSLDVMVEDDLLNLIYAEGFGQKGAYKQLEKVFELISHKEPRLKILELGAGTGGATRPVLRVLQGMSAQPKYMRYTFTDVSTAFLATAQDNFEQYHNMEFSILNIEHDTLEQGFALGTYDIVLAANVIHATSNIVKSLENCRKLLKPKGKLIIQETTKHLLVGGYMLGSLPGYWLGAQDGRPSSPFISKEEWNARLLKAGLSGNDVTLNDYPEPDDCTSVIISSNSTPKIVDDQVNGATKGVTEKAKPMSNGVNGDIYKSEKDEEIIWLIYRHRPHPLVAEIKRFYDIAHVPTRIIPLSQVESQISKGARTIMCAELEAPLLSRMTETDMTSLHKYTLLASSAVWLTAGGMMTGASPEHSLVFGLSKSIMTEQPSFALSTFDIDPGEREYARSAEMIVEHEMQLHEHPDEQLDTELVEKDGVVHISRYITDDVQNKGFQRQFDANPLPSRWRAALELDFTKVGQIGTFFFKEKKEAQGDVPEGHVLLEARAFAMDKKVRRHCCGFYKDCANIHRLWPS
jgi:SAM-dependent methyltransferase